MTLAAPIMLWGLVAVPLLAAVYWFRSRSRRVAVSSLMLWVDQRRARQGGQVLRRMQTPLSFFLELLAIILLVLAAAGPAVIRTEQTRPLMVVLDDSFSMQAAGDVRRADSPRRRAEAELLKELGRDNYSARLVLAGVEPRLLGAVVRTAADARGQLDAWTCRAPTADLQRAVADAAEIGGPTARILVLTDQPPPAKLEGGQMEWRAVGAKLPNAAIVTALRGRSAETDRVLIEVANLSDAPARTALTIEGGNLSAAKRTPLELAPNALKQFFFDLPSDAPELKATLDDDALMMDNRAWLLPASIAPVRVRVDLADAKLREHVRHALDAAGGALVSDERPELIVCDRAIETDAGTEAWRLEIVAAAETSAYGGPFVIDRSHPLCVGISLDGAIWSADSNAKLGGAVVTAGNVPLLSDNGQTTGRRLRMNFVAERSNLQDVPDWPILFANLLRWRRESRPGPAMLNARLGQTVAVTLPGDVKQVELSSPGAAARKLHPRQRRVEVPAEAVGVYALKAPPDIEYTFACNAVARDESDLSAAAAGRWGDWNTSAVHQQRQFSLRWALLLAALVVLAGHQKLISLQSVRSEA